MSYPHLIPEHLRTLPVDVYNRGWVQYTTDFPRELSYSECACKHCGSIGTGMSIVLVEAYMNVRRKIKMPLGVNSGYRCPLHNKNVGGEEFSTHMSGMALDIRVPTQFTYDEFFRLWVNEPLFTGLGYYPTRGFVHVDVRQTIKRVLFQKGGHYA